MPCFSRITTAMDNANRAAEALKAQGFTVTSVTELLVTTKEGLKLYRNAVTDKFNFSSSDSVGIQLGGTSKLAEVGRKYAELSARAWAQKKGLVVRNATADSLTVVSTRK